MGLLNIAIASESKLMDNKYSGNWPTSKNKSLIIKNSNTNKMDCPNGVGCQCICQEFLWKSS